MPKYSTLFCTFPGQNHLFPSAASWMTHAYYAMSQDGRLERCDIWDPVDTPIPMLRNRAVKMAQEGEYDFLLMIDSDMAPPMPDEENDFLKPAFDFMIGNPDAGAIFSPYCGPSPHNNIYVFQYNTLNNSQRPGSWSLEQFSREEAARRGGVEEVAAGPTGLILYRTSAFDYLAKPGPYFYYEWSDGWQTGKGSTEDVAQTRDMSLAWHMSHGQRGGKIYCLWDCWSGHVKLQTVPGPMIMPIESVAERLREAVLLGHSQGDKVYAIGKNGRQGVLGGLQI